MRREAGSFGSSFVLTCVSLPDSVKYKRNDGADQTSQASRDRNDQLGVCKQQKLSQRQENNDRISVRFSYLVPTESRFYLVNLNYIFTRMLSGGKYLSNCLLLPGFPSSLKGEAWMLLVKLMESCLQAEFLPLPAGWF